MACSGPQAWVGVPPSGADLRTGARGQGPASSLGSWSPGMKAALQLPLSRSSSDGLRGVGPVRGATCPPIEPVAPHSPHQGRQPGWGREREQPSHHAAGGRGTADGLWRAQRAGPSLLARLGSGGCMGWLGHRAPGGLAGNVNLGLDGSINNRSLRILGGQGSPRAKTLRAGFFTQRGSGPGRPGGQGWRMAGLGSSQENIWRLDSRPGAKFSESPCGHPPPHLPPNSFSL